MQGLVGIWRAARGAAFVAVALLTLAGVRAQVMQAAELSPAPVCAMGMPGMVMGDAPAAPAPGKAHKVCEFCVAAAHAPLPAEAARPVAPVTTVTLAAYAAWRTLGPRGPPAVPPKARGPPNPILTA